MNFSDLALSNQKADYRFEILHPTTGEGLGAFIKVISAQSDQAKTYLDKQLRKAHLQEIENAKSRRPHIKSLAEISEENIDMAINRIVDWENVQWEDKPLPFNAENAKKLLTECDWIVQQIFEHSNDLGKFLATSSQTCSIMPNTNSP